MLRVSHRIRLSHRKGMMMRVEFLHSTTSAGIVWFPTMLSVDRRLRFATSAESGRTVLII